MIFLKNSISASIFIFVVVILRAIFLHILPRKTFLLLWGVALIRLIIPVSVSSPLSVYNLVGRVAVLFMKTGDTSILDNTDFIEMLPNTEALIQNQQTGAQASTIMLVWLIGLALCAIFFVITHLRCRKDYNMSLPIESDFISKWQKEHSSMRHIQVRQSDKIFAPLTYGIFQPVILLPKTMNYADGTQLQYILTHEYIHIKRFDTLKKWLLAAVVSIHWFNPLVWVLYVLANRDIELSCDETVVRTLGENIKSDYAMALINLEERKSRFCPVSNSFSKNSIEERIISIMKIKKTSAALIIVAAILITGTTAAFATVAANKTVDSALPEGYESHEMVTTTEGNWEEPVEVDSSVDVLVAVNKNDEGKFTAKEWQEILEKVEKGEILFFDTLEEETAYFHGSATNLS